MTKKGSLQWIREVTKYLVSSTALAGALFYSSPSNAQEPKPPEKVQEENKDQPKEEPKQEPQLPEPKPKPKKEKDIEVKYVPQPKDTFSLHLFGGASPNEENQGSTDFADLNFSLKDKIRFGLFSAYSSSSIEDSNGIRTVTTSPSNLKTDLFADLGKGNFITLGFRQGLEEVIRRTTTVSSNNIGTSNLLTISRAKVRNIEEHYGGKLDLDLRGFRFSLAPYSTNLPTITTHELYQKVTDPNPTANFESSFEFRDPTPRIRRNGLAARLGYTKWYNADNEKASDDVTMVTDLIGILEEETIKLKDAEDREIQRILIGGDVYLFHSLFTPRIALLKGFLNERPTGERYTHGPNATKLFLSGYLDVSGIVLSKKVLKSKDPKVESITKETKLPLLAGGSFYLDRVRSGSDKVSVQDARAVLGIGSASGSEALSAIAKLEDDLVLKDLSLLPEEGRTLSALHSQWEKYLRPFPLAVKPNSRGLLLTLRGYKERINSKKGIGYEGRAYLILNPLIFNIGAGYNEIRRERSFNAGVAFKVEDWISFGGDYTESRANHENTGTYSFGARIDLR